MATQAGVAYVTIAYDPAAVQKLREQTRAEGQRLASSWDKVGSSASRVGSKLTRSLTIPIVAAGAAATKYTYDFDQSMNHIQALVGANTKQMDYYRKAVLALAPAVGQGPQDLAKALYFITSSGFKGAHALDVLKASAKGAASGLGDTQTIADLVTSAINVYGQKNLSAAHAVDVLTQAVKDGKGEPADYATAMGRVIPVAQNLGVSFDQVGAALAALTLGGFSADKATTGLQSIFTNLEKPSKSAEAALKGVGLSAGQIRDEIKNKGLLPALLDLNKAFDGNGVALRKVFTNGKAIVPFLSLTGQAAKKNVGIFNDLAHSTGASEQAFGKQSQTAAFQIQQSFAKIQVAAVQAGGILLPVFARVAQALAGLLTDFDHLPQGAQNFIVFGGIAVAALGPVLTAFGNVAQAAKGLKIAMLGVEGGFKGVLPLLATNPWIGVGLAVAAVGAYAILTSGQTDEMARSLDNARRASDELGRALSGLKQSNLDVRQAELDRANAADRVREADRKVAQLARDGKKGTREYTQAVRDQKQAEIDLGDAKLRVQQADAGRASQQHEIAKASKAQLDSIKKIGDAANRTAVQESRLSHGSLVNATAADRQREATRRAQIALDEFRKGTSKLAGEQAELAAKFRDDSNPQMAKAKDKTAELALAALDLTRKIGRIPTEKQINVYYKHNMAQLREQARLLAGEIATIPSTKTVSIQFAQAHGTPLATTTGKSKKGNARGGVFMDGIRAHAGGGLFTGPTLLGRDLFGEAGREAVVPLDSEYGKRTLAEALREAGIGGKPEIRVYVGNEPVDARVEYAMKRTAQTIRSGRKWATA